MARMIWGDEDPIGRCIRLAEDATPCYTVVGVVGDIVRGFAEGPTPHMYVSWWQQPSPGSGVFVRTRGPAADVMESVRRGLQPLMPGPAYVEAWSVQDFVDPEMRPFRLGATMFTLFGALALLLAAVGLFSVISYNVSQRTHELGVRIALGAGAADLLRLVMREGLTITIIGTMIGVIVALLTGRFLTPLLFSVSPRDPLTYVVVVATLIVAALGATLLPALRASRVDPNVALRSD
jgi:ABC-type antimicrobial peptide transport system permease subunit